MVKKTSKTSAMMMMMTMRHPTAGLSSRLMLRPRPAGPAQHTGRTGLQGNPQLSPVFLILSDCKMEGWWGCRSILISRWSFLWRAALATLRLHHPPKVLRILPALTGSPSQPPVGAACLGSTPALAPRGLTTSLLFMRMFSTTPHRAAGLP